MNDKPQTVEHLSDWLAYYQIAINDIKFAKRQQWYLCYYALLIFGAIIGLTQIENICLDNYKIEIKRVAIIIATIVSYFLVKFQKDLYRYRNDVQEIIQSAFPVDLEKIIDYPKASKWYYYSDFLFFLIAVVWAGYFAVWLVLRSL